MSYISESYMRTRDIDWFAVVDGHPCHFASNGGMLPACLTDRETLLKLQWYAAQMEDIPNVEIEINELYVKSRLAKNQQVNMDDNNIRAYLRSFMEYARKGFVSYDRVNPEDLDCNQYMWIARPKNDYQLLNQVCEKISSFGGVVKFQRNEQGSVAFAG